MKALVGMLAVALVAGVVPPAGAAPVLCKKKSGAVVVRDPACRKKEKALDLAQFGAVGPKGDKGDSGSPDTADQVRAKFFAGTACPGNDPADIMVKVGSICLDKYEASVWNASNSTQYGVSGADYPCDASGNDCAFLLSDQRIFARSVAE
jgi:hypothetical protein